MAKAGDELLNSVTGLRTVFRKALAFIGRQLGYRAEYLYLYARQSETSRTVSKRSARTGSEAYAPPGWCLPEREER